jgi:hypothetical protein
MDKRIHKKRSSNLTYRHYLFHFKWPLLGLIFVFTFLSLIQMNITSYIYSSDPIDENFEISFTDVIYPIDIFNEKNLNQSILYYFQRKDQLKAVDDAKSIDRKEKVILPLINNISSSNSYLILEFTKVFFRPRFCSHTKEEIFGETCPFTNWYV